MTHSDLQWLRSEMERVIELGEKGTQKPWRHTGERFAERVVFEKSSLLRIAEAQSPVLIQASHDAALIVAAVNYSAAWARHVLRLIERVGKCECQSRVPGSVLILLKDNEVTTRNWVPEDGCEECKSDRSLLSALIADMRKDGGK